MNKTIKLILLFVLLFTVSCAGNNNKKANQESQLEKCFYAAGLKYEVTIRLTEQPDGEIIGSVISDEYETQQFSANFTGTIYEGKINVKFQGEPPIVGDRSEWLPDKPWRLETKNGKEILVITFNSQNFDTNKWEATDWEFEKVECGEIPASEPETSKTEEPVVETELVVNNNYPFTESGELKLDNDRYTIRAHEKTEDVGEIIAIMDKQNKQTFSISGDSPYYYDTYNNYLIIDEGTGAIRTLYVFNLDTRNAIYKTDYCSDLKLDKQNGKIIFQTKIKQLPAGATAEATEDQKEMMKENPNAFGYAKTRNFNLKTLKEEHSGKFELKYFE